jgi:hypothetical protein
LDRAGARSERVVVELLGELERCTRVFGPFLEAPRPGEATMDERLQRRARGRLAQRCLEQRGRTIEALELGEEDECLRAYQADFHFGQQVGRNRSGARPFARSLMRTSCSQCSTMALTVLVRRRQPERLLGELGPDG